MVKPKDQSNQNIAVYVRCRPLSIAEKKMGSCSVVEASTERKEVIVRDKSSDKLSKTFTFDRVFDQNTPQVDLYKVVVSPLLEEVLKGYSCTVFAYGQTGTGKTYTMEGERHLNRNTSWEEDPHAGVVPRAMHHLFETLREQALDYSLRVSYLELYNEELFDLLAGNDDPSKIRILEDRKGAVIVSGIQELHVHSKDEVYTYLERGAQKRQTAATLMNANSSRSHTIFSITVHIRDNNTDGEELIRTGKLNLVDLAGSENIGRSGAVDRRAREAGNINQSLLTLGRVITALVERCPHVPYRESKLTRLLQDSLGGKTKTSIIATISPALINLEETLGTLEYAHRARNITNKPEANQKTTKAALIKQYAEEIERLRRDLTATQEKNGIYLDPKVYHELNQNVSSKSEEIEALILEIEAKKAEYDKLMEMFTATSKTLEIRTHELDRTQVSLNETRNNLQSTICVLHKTAEERDENRHLVAVHVKNEKEITSQAVELIKVADTATTDTYKLHDKVDRKTKVESHNAQQHKTFHEKLQQTSDSMATNICDSEQAIIGFRKNLMSYIDKQEVEHVGNMCNASKTKLNLLGQNISGGLKKIGADLGQQISSVLTSEDELRKKLKKQKVENISAIEKFEKEIQNPSLETTYAIFDSHAEYARQSQKIYTDETKNSQLSLASYQDSSNLNCRLKNPYNDLSQNETAKRNSQQTSMRTIQENRDLYKSELDNWSKKMMNVMMEFYDINQKFSPIWEKNDSDMNQAVKDAEDCRKNKDLFVNSMVTQLQAEAENFIKTTNDNANKNIALAEAKLKKFEEDVEEDKKTISSYAEDLRKFNKFSKETSEQNYERNVKEIQTQVETLQSTLAMQQKIRDECLRIMTENTDDLSKDLTSGQEKLEASALEMKNETTNTSAYLITNHKETSNLIQNLKLELSKYEESLQVDKPTGFTPGRREFSYPTTLTATSPHDTILGRYRARKNQAFNLPLPLSLDEEKINDEFFTSQSETESHNSSLSSAASLGSNLDLSGKNDDSKENQPMQIKAQMDKPQHKLNKKPKGKIPTASTNNKKVLKACNT